MVDAVGFDLDGTLFDDRQYVRDGFESAAKLLEKEVGLNVYGDLIDAYFERGIREHTFDVVVDEYDLPYDFVPRLVSAYHDNVGSLTPYPETESVLAELTETYELGVVTGGTNGAKKIDELGLSEYFDAVIVTARMDTSKLDCKPFEVLLTELGVGAEETVYVGDRSNLDFPRPNELGMYTVRVMTGQYTHREPENGAGPDFNIESLEELPSLIESLD
jgi:putative hydrolase of the HAD superfamily